MNFNSIKKLQKQFGYDDMQKLINDGTAWKLEGSVGREAMRLLESGTCMLPKKPTFDYYGNRLPSRDELKKGTKGTYQNSVNFWEGVVNGDIEIYPEYEFEDFE